jgi:acyl-[acyl-carrier-protein]-phospholipid O-acyltransferase / long-chain-fatty-acid--[acyl-carrier-protein] ligase
MPAKLLKPIGRFLLRILFRVRVVGGLGPVHLGGDGAERLLIIANHESFLDGIILALFLPAHPVFVVHTYVAENRWFRLGLRLVDFLTLDPTSPLAMRQVVRLLESGRPVLIFPEGRITTTGSLMKVYDGPAFAAVKTGAAIVPVRAPGGPISGGSRGAIRASSCPASRSRSFRRPAFPKAPPPRPGTGGARPGRACAGSCRP